MAALQKDDTFMIKVMDDFESQLSRVRGAGTTSSLSGAFVHDQLVKRLVFEEGTLEEISNGGKSRTGSRPSSDVMAIDRQQAAPSPSAIKRSWSGEEISTRTQIIKLENTVATLKTENKRNKLDFGKQLDELKTRFWREKEAGQEMRLKLQQVLDREEQRRKELTECSSTFKTKMKESRERTIALEKENADLHAELNQLTTESDETVFQMKSDLYKESTEKDLLQSKLEAAEERLQEYSTKSMNVVEQMRIADEATTKAKEVERRVKELELELSKHEDDKKLTRILQNQLAKLPDLEKENRILKEENRVHRMRDENIILLKEDLEAVKNALNRSESLCAELPKFQLENEDLRQKLASWEKFLSIVQQGQTKSPQNVAKAISRLQQQETILLERAGTLTASNNALKTAKSAIEAKLRETSETMQKQERLMKRHADQVRHLQRKLLLVAKERDFYHQLVDNYEKETTVLSSSLHEDERFQRLESLVDGYKTSMENLEAELELTHQQLTKFGHNSGVEIEEERSRLEGEIKKLQASLSKSEDQTRQLVEEKTALEVQVEYFTLKGEFNPLKTRVVHLSSNPVAWERDLRVDEVNRLKCENDNLRQRLKLLEEAGGCRVEDLTIQVGEKLKDAPSAKDVEEMKGQLNSAELKNKRLVEAFRKLSADFREVAYTLLGYKLELTCNNQFKFSSAYAESEDHYLLFEKSDSGQFRLLETPYSTEIADKIKLYLHSYHSIPAFLSNLTLELFKSQTAVPSTSFMDVTTS